ncbi:Nif3-like dinuclear metal center hexameric protein [Caminicella sporogenes]|uniref:Nif3-like dinuclear metal center hexameric protein n=1 Tax=Caminicella sporogenes TaxID=166485 RepID=UPI0025426801|nr:Nif3-like dinuclear metal center hexameric protein [Caminicella sporogenes]WIF94778.1 Nif3-like dinuclear metal center hexameric protein [Caminicella sporogenes]
MSVKCSKVIKMMEELAPSFLAEHWDNVGLQIGSISKEIKKIMVCLEVNNKVVDEAVEKKVDMIITHHPLIFKPIKKINYSEPIGKVINKLIKNDINLFCAHTNLDIAVGGTSDYIAKLLNLDDLKPLKITHKTKYYKLAVFVPKENIDDVREAISLAGAGHIGKYSHCTFKTLGIGTFKPLEGSNPFIGSLNNLEKVEEYKLETIVPSSNLSKVISEMIKVHPYEEVAYDVFPLENEFEIFGFGRIGHLTIQKTLKELAIELKEKLKADTIRLIGNEHKMIKKVAICTGSGAEFIIDAYRNGCDCYITGDIKYHDAQYASELGLTVIDAGHFETENIICEFLKEYLITKLKSKNYDLEIISSNLNINPFTYI